MRRFVAILTLALIGGIWCLLFADYVMRCAAIAAFLVAAVLPAVMNPTRHWARGFFLCFDIVYAAACVGAWLASTGVRTTRLDVFAAGIVPGLIFGMMASLGVGRSGLGELER